MRWRRCPRRCRGRSRSHPAPGRKSRGPLPIEFHARSTAMKTLRSFVEGKWVEGKEPFATLVNPATEEPLARTSTNGIDFAAALEFSRTQGGPALRELTFAQRGELLKAWSNALHAARAALI